MTASQCISSCRHGWGKLLKFKRIIRKGKKGDVNFQGVVVLSERWSRRKTEKLPDSNFSGVNGLRLSLFLEINCDMAGVIWQCHKVTTWFGLLKNGLVRANYQQVSTSISSNFPAASETIWCHGAVAQVIEIMAKMQNCKHVLLKLLRQITISHHFMIMVVACTPVNWSHIDIQPAKEKDSLNRIYATYRQNTTSADSNN